MLKRVDEKKCLTKIIWIMKKNWSRHVLRRKIAQGCGGEKNVMIYVRRKKMMDHDLKKSLCHCESLVMKGKG